MVMVLLNSVPVKVKNDDHDQSKKPCCTYGHGPLWKALPILDYSPCNILILKVCGCCNWNLQFWLMNSTCWSSWILDKTLPYHSIIWKDLGTFKTNSLLPTRRSGGRKMGLVSQCLCFWPFAGHWYRTIRIRIRIAAASHDTMPLRSLLFWGLRPPFTEPKHRKPEKSQKSLSRGVWDPPRTLDTQKVSKKESTPNMTGRRFHRTMETIPTLPW